MTDVNRGFTLSWPEYDFLWEHLKLSRRPVVLDIPSTGYTMDERATLRAKAWETLAAKRYGTPRDPHPDLANCLAALANPQWEIDARLHLSQTGPRDSGLAAANGRYATLARLTADSLTVAPIHPESLIREIVALLPDHPAGTGRSITFPADTLDRAAARAGSNPDALRTELRGAGLGNDEATKVAEVLGNVIRYGQFGATRTLLPARTRERAPHVITFYDNPTGRYLFNRKTTNARTWVTLLPATPATITREIGELTTQLARLN
jgi:hypothetical protein